MRVDFLRFVCAMSIMALVSCQKNETENAVSKRVISSSDRMTQEIYKDGKLQSSNTIDLVNTYVWDGNRISSIDTKKADGSFYSSQTYSYNSDGTVASVSRRIAQGRLVDSIFIYRYENAHKYTINGVLIEEDENGQVIRETHPADDSDMSSVLVYEWSDGDCIKATSYTFLKGIPTDTIVSDFKYDNHPNGLKGSTPFYFGLTGACNHNVTLYCNPQPDQLGTNEIKMSYTYGPDGYPETRKTVTTYSERGIVQTTESIYSYE